MALIGINPFGSPSTPRASAPWYRLIRGDTNVLFVVEGSGIYTLDEATISEFDENPDSFFSLRCSPPPAPELPPYPTALSLNIAQTCNLACAYCYADEGRFGSQPRLMPLEVALQTIGTLMKQSSSSQVSVGFIGGEPLLNRSVLHAAVGYAVSEAAQRGISVSFGITTNATLLEPRDIELLRSHPFAVSVSLDGRRHVHDAVRSSRNGHGSFEQAIERIRPLLELPRLARVAARCTVTRLQLDVEDSVNALLDAGFEEVGISPLRTGPDNDLRLRDEDWETLLASMKRTAANDWDRVRHGASAFRFGNLAMGLKQLHRGAANLLPCNSAVRYVSVSVEGDYYTCHRTVGDSRFLLGNRNSGPSRESRASFVAARRVDTQEPCRSCWARYLCGGGCHAEVIQSGRSGCDYIRGWLEHCIALYTRVLAERPDLLQ